MTTQKQFIESKLRAGRSAEQALKDFEAAYPGRHCGWGYVQKIARGIGKEAAMHGTKFNPYAELDVPRDATAPEVKAAFRKRAKKVHPDKPGTGNAELFQRAHRALTLLTDPGRRERYDRTGDAEEEKPDNIRAIALQIIEAFIAGAMDAFVAGGMKRQDDPRRRDLVTAFKSQIRRDILEIENAFVQAKHVREFFEDMGARFETKDPTDPIRRANEARLRGVDAKVATMREALASRKLALEIIHLYRFRADTSPLTGGFA